ncbi:hypothetical protein N9N67_07220 [Bacteriovoracaceae bacterium]|nr:hypothetical protein [Bacteriovoracaceae bacterium]
MWEMHFLDILNKVDWRFKLLSIIFIALTFTLKDGLAYPDRFEFWVLSKQDLVTLKKINRNQDQKNYYVQYNKPCVQMGDYCFDPQIGLYKKDASLNLNNVNDKTTPERISNLYLERGEEYDFIQPLPKSVDRELVVCDSKSTFFDVFCGQAKGTTFSKDQYQLEVWVDISSTFREVDWSMKQKATCHRQRFVEAIDNFCPLREKLGVYIFTESKRQLGALNDLCINYGLNNLTKMKKDIRDSNAKHLIIITDIAEYSSELSDFVNTSQGRGKIIGGEKAILAKDLVSMAQSLKPKCK